MREYSLQKRISLAIATVFLAAILVGCQANQKSKSSQSEATKEVGPREIVTIKAPSPTPWISPYDIANKKGWLKEEGIELEYTGAIYGGPESILAVSAGTNDVTISTALSAVVNAAAQGLDLKAVLATSGVSPQVPGKWFVRKDSGIQSAGDLVGKKVGVNTLKAALDYQISEYLKQNGLERSDVQLIVIQQPAALQQAFRQGQIDLVYGDDRFFTFTEGGGVRVLFTGYSVYKRNMAGSVILFGKRFIKEKPDVVRRFVRANAKALDWAAEQPEEARELVKQILEENGQNPDLAAYWPGFGAPEHGVIAKQDFQYWVGKFVEEGTLEKEQIGLDEVYTNEFNPYYSER